MSVLTSGFGSSQQAEYQISRSLRFNSADSAYLNRTPSVAGNRKTWTWSGWVKKSSLGGYGFLLSAGTSSTTSGYVGFGFDLDGIYLSFFSGSSHVYKSTAVFRDPSAWMHVVVAVDTSQATSDNRVKIYINGTQLTVPVLGGYTAVPQDFLCNINNTVEQVQGHGRNSAGSRVDYFNGYLAEVNFIDGTALTPSSFGEFDSVTGVWKPKKYTGTYGTNGFYLNFSDNSATTATTLGKDYSGNNNNWTPNNFSVTAGADNDSMVDTPTPYGTDTGVGGQVRGNYCTLNPLDSYLVTVSNGNLVGTASTLHSNIRGTVLIPETGKFYFEGNTNSVLGGKIMSLGLSIASIVNSTGFTAAGYYSVYLGYSPGTANLYINNNGTNSTFNPISSPTVNDGYQVAYDADSGKLWLGFAGSWKNSSGVTDSSANPATGANPTLTIPLGTRLVPYFHLFDNSGTINFGQRPFAYTAPSGFKALCTTNLPEPTIKKGSNHFNTVTYTGNGGTNSITGVGFGPGLTWIKSRSGMTDHALYDTVRGATKQLESNTITAETTESTGLTSFGTDGFTLGSLAQLNTSGATYVGWNWKGGGTAVTNTQGTITSQVSANPSAGFSIVTYTGNGVASATVGHGLGVSPNMVIIKNRSDAIGRSWIVFTSMITTQSSGSVFTSSIFNIGSKSGGVLSYNLLNGRFSYVMDEQTNANTNTYVAYCFAEIPGYSAFGSYTGNGSTDGPFVYTGFRPAYLMIKNTSGDGHWLLLDNKRLGYNPTKQMLQANTNNVAIESQEVDVLSNGFKVRSDWSYINASTSIYIYAAFAEVPYKFALGR